MKILIYGAGIIGSIYAARLFESGQEVTLLARGKRFEELKHNGISLKNGITGTRTKHKIPVLKELLPYDNYDLIIITVRLDQLESVIPNLRKNAASPLLLFMLNNPDGLANIQRLLPNKKILMGFPGVGGTREGDTIKFVEIKQQKTTFGEIDGRRSNIIKNLKKLFENAGFKTEISLRIEDWLKTHAVFISCVTASIINFNGNSEELANSKPSVKLMIQSIREGFKALESLHIAVEPKNLKLIFMTMPTWFSVLYWQKAMCSDLGKLAIAPHALKAKEEMQLVAAKMLALIGQGTVATPKLNYLIDNFIKDKT